MYLPRRYRKATLATITKNPPTDTSLYIYGNSGCGKTYMAAALFNNDRLDGIQEEDILFVSTLNLLLQFQSTFGNPSVSLMDVIKKYSTVENLYLDDLGAEKVTDWSISALLAVIDARYSEMKRTVITSNHSINELAKVLGDRVSSRIDGMCSAIKITASDKRQEEPAVHRITPEKKPKHKAEIDEMIHKQGTRFIHLYFKNGIDNRIIDVTDLEDDDCDEYPSYSVKKMLDIRKKQLEKQYKIKVMEVN